VFKRYRRTTFPERSETSCSEQAHPLEPTIVPAVRARSRADFVAKLGIVEEECDESSYWMELIVALKLLKKTRLEDLQKEASELVAIIVASIKTARHSKRK
jgi:hypothetical protein